MRSIIGCLITMNKNTQPPLGSMQSSVLVEFGQKRQNSESCNDDFDKLCKKPPPKSCEKWWEGVESCKVHVVVIAGLLIFSPGEILIFRFLVVLAGSISSALCFRSSSFLSFLRTHTNWLPLRLILPAKTTWNPHICA